jgi:hypothetical protein
MLCAAGACPSPSVREIDTSESFYFLFFIFYHTII